MKKTFIYLPLIILFILICIFAFNIPNKNNKLTGIYDSLVYIESINDSVTKTGSGFVYDESNDKNYILTCYHVIEDSNQIYVYNTDKKRAKASIVGFDAYSDIAILLIDDKLDLKSAKPKNSDKIEVGDNIYVAGTPQDPTYISTITKGIISFKNRKMGNLETIQIDAPLSDGNSGSALIDINANVIGMVFLKEEDASNIGFAIPINYVIEIAEKIRNDEKRPNLGAVMANATNEELLSENDIKINSDSGVVIIKVYDNFALDNAEIKKGDVITRLNNINVYNIDSLKDELYKFNIGDEVEIEYIRDGNSFETSLILT